MIVIHAIMLWFLVSIHVVGGACLFRRYFPKESPWLGFIVPSLAIPIVCNFIEHEIALTRLPWLLPITFVGSTWMMISPKMHWRFLWRPTLVFLLSFTIPFVVRCIRPDIGAMRDGPIDTCLVANFMMGDTLPPDSTWMPGFKLMYYYDFQHYAASLLARLFTLDPGTGFNVSGALLQGFIFFCTGAIAWRVGKQRLWIAVLVVMMTSTALVGINGYLWFFEPGFHEPDDATRMLNHAVTTNPDHVPFDPFIQRVQDEWGAHELFPLGYWAWTGGLHSPMGGQFLTLFSVMCLLEMVRRRRCIVPWVGAVSAIPLLLITSTWGVPMVTLFLLAGSGWCFYHKIYPANWRAVVIAIASVCACLTPLLVYFLQVRTPSSGMGPDDHTQLAEFVFQFWPFWIPWFLLLFYYRQLNPITRIVHAITPLILIGMEFYSLGCRADMTGKVWADVYGAAWAVFIPTMLGMRSYVLRGVAGLFIVACVISTCFWVDYVHRNSNHDVFCQLDGRGDIRFDPTKGRIYNVVASVNHKIIVVGVSTWSYSENALLATLTGNKAYITWSFHVACAFHPDSFDEAGSRERDINDIYAGTSDDPKLFLREHHIEMFVIWPEDDIPNDILDKLKQQLAPDFRYQDCRGISPQPNAPTAGVFLAQHLTDSPKFSAAPHN